MGRYGNENRLGSLVHVDGRVIERWMTIVMMIEMMIFWRVSVSKRRMDERTLRRTFVVHRGYVGRALCAYVLFRFGRIWQSGVPKKIIYKI